MTQDLANRTGKRLRELREQRGLSQEQLGVAAGLTARTVRRIEQGEDTRMGSLHALAGVLDVPITDLIGDEPAPAA